MATVTIPAEGRGGNPVRVMINGVEYVIPRGVETTVSDAVAAELAKLGMALIGGTGYPEDPRILPVVDATDNDKVLTVVNGAWEPAAAGSGLPEVSASNNGNVLTVVSGEWAAAAPSGGGGNVLVVPLTVEEVDDELEFTATKTAGEMAAADVLVYTYPVAEGLGTIKAMGNSVIEIAGNYVFEFYDNSHPGFPIQLSASSADEYPTNGSGGAPA